MRKYGRITLYLCESEITNWPGSFRMPVTYQRHGRHNIAGTRTDAWFTFEKQSWHGVLYGQNTQLIHCRKVAS